MGTEQQLHQQVCEYIRLTHKGVLFHSDFGSGIKLTMGQAAKQKRLQSGRAWPDLLVAEPRGQYFGLFIELKREGTTLWRKDGMFTSNQHVQEQMLMLMDLRRRGYRAEFGVGLAQTIDIIDSYLRQSPKE